ncbi:hypothetical protein SDC9_121233 [bioreactor metagenome]|uniref:Uncharacterized protein n=1 Tax=bioreactor metagenome TaxID=1076179 RepID=A0A645CBH5_9ZZZZ
MIQKTVHLDDVAGQNLALPGNAVLQFLHELCPPLLISRPGTGTRVFSISSIIMDRTQFCNCFYEQKQGFMAAMLVKFVFMREIAACGEEKAA